MIDWKHLTTETFVELAKQIHGDKYGYSKVEYKNSNTKVCIICPEHGEFWQMPYDHIICKKGCGKCSGHFKYTTKYFIECANKVHNNFYDYSEVVYPKNNKIRIPIICPIHGRFWQSPGNHLKGQGCPQCSNIKRSTSQCNTLESMINSAKKIHGDKYDYSNSIYVNAFTPIEIKCNHCGTIFKQTPTNHIHNKAGCPQCARKLVGIKCRLTQEEFEKRANKIHNNFYVYSKTKYKTVEDDITIICPKHGEFIQNAGQHLSGHGCPRCRRSKLEESVAHLLKTNNIKFIDEYNEIKEFKTIKNGKQSLDFYLPDYNIAIECQGEQHFKPVDFGNKGEETTMKAFNRIQYLDERKKQICEDNGIRLLYFAKNNYNRDDLITDTNILLKKILEHDKL